MYKKVYIYNPDLFRLQINFCPLVATWLCLYFRRYRLIFKDSINYSLQRVLTPWVELHIAHVPSIILFEPCNNQPKRQSNLYDIVEINSGSLAFILKKNLGQRRHDEAHF